MSSAKVSNKSIVKKPYCKVCHDAGKPESEYSSHWVKQFVPGRSGQTIITCPTLLSTECRYCFKLGHTTKFCPIIEKNKKDKERAERMNLHKEKVPKKEIKSAVTSSIFAALQTDSSSDSEDERESKVQEEKTMINSVERKEEFPALPTVLKATIKIPVVKSETSWASVASSSKEVIKNVIPVTKPEANESRYNKPIYTKSWADWSDSDSDEDTVEDYPQQEISQKAISMPSGYDSDW